MRTYSENVAETQRGLTNKSFISLLALCLVFWQTLDAAGQESSTVPQADIDKFLEKMNDALYGPVYDPGADNRQFKSSLSFSEVRTLIEVLEEAGQSHGLYSYCYEAMKGGITTRQKDHMFKLIEKTHLDFSTMNELLRRYEEKFDTGANWPRMQIVLSYNSDWTKLQSVCDSAGARTEFKERTEKNFYVQRVEETVLL